MDEIVTKEKLYAAIVERILKEKQSFKSTPYNLMKDVCKARFNRDFNTTGLSEFEMYDIIIQNAKENHYSTRLAPVPGGQMGLPYTFDYFFYPNELH